MDKIVIDLDGERDAYAVSDLEDLVHPKEWNQLKEMINSSVELSDTYLHDKWAGKSSNLIPVRRHDTIMLAGVRGSGKTTFMLSVLEYIDQNKYVDGIQSIGIIDPTLIEEKVHIFVNIISMVKDIVNEKAKKQNCFSEDNEFSRKYQEWKDSFRRLAEGLPSINGVGADGFADDAWLDSEFVMNKGVQRAHAANTLERNFHDYIFHSLNFIKKKAFVLCFDDIDTHFDKGWPVLEVIHKYLTTPQFITILSGDPQLYSTLIRQKQWGNFSDKLLSMEACSEYERQSFKDTVAHLEEQYLLKLFKPERRIFLSSLYQKDQDPNYSINVKRKDKKEEPLKAFYYKLMKEVGIISGSQQQTCYRFIASLPIRTQKQLLHSFDNAPDKITHSISDVFWSDLSYKNVDVSSLRNAPQHIVPDVLDYLVTNRILNEGYTLAPVFSDQLMNGAQFALGSLMTSRIKQEPGLVFDYWIRIALSRGLGSLWKDQAEGNKGGPSVKNLITHCAMNQGRTASDVARLTTSYIRASRGFDIKGSYDQKTSHGTIPLSALYRKNKNDPDKTRIDTVLNDIKTNNGLAGLMGCLPLSGVTNHKGYTLPVYSFYNILGVLSELIYSIKGLENKEALKKIFFIIRESSQFREFPLPEWVSSQIDITGESSGETIEEEYDEIDCEPSEEFAKEITRWVKEGMGIVVSASVLGKIFTRFFYAMNDMDKKLSAETRLGEWIHRMMVAFLNSIVVVEALEDLDSQEVTLSLLNPITKDKIFLENLKKINEKEINKNDNKLTFSKWILSCPVWLFYLKEELLDLELFLFPNADDTDRELTSDKPTFAANRKMWSGTLYNGLNKVVVKGQATPKPVKIDFSVNDSSHLEDAKNVFIKAEKDPRTILFESIQTILTLLKTELNTKYEEKKITKTTVKSIRDRIEKGTMTW